MNKQKMIDNYKKWRKTEFVKLKELYKNLANEQNPKVMIISCCDSRIDPNKIFDAKPGEFFVHRNIANLVPKYKENKSCATSSSLEFAIKELKIKEIYILGHSNCAGIQRCKDKIYNNLDYSLEFVDKWITELDSASDKDVSKFEKLGIKLSMENLKTFPFIKDKLENNSLQVYGMWNDIETGDLYITNNMKFEKII